MSRMPNVYRGELQAPLRWQDDVTGILPTAVRLFFTCVVEKRRLAPTQFELVRDYCQYYIDAPCWDSNPYHDDETRATLAGLRAAIREVQTALALDEWLLACLEEGIDPL